MKLFFQSSQFMNTNLWRVFNTFGWRFFLWIVFLAAPFGKVFAEVTPTVIEAKELKNRLTFNRYRDGDLGGKEGLQALERIAIVHTGGGSVPRIDWRFLKALPKDKITHLTLSGLGLRDLPRGVEAFVRLKELDLSQNRLVKVPFKIGRLRVLEVLNLSGNQMSVVGPSLLALGQLKRLDLSKNRLGFFPALRKPFPNLETLNLAGNQIRRLASSFSKAFPALENLDLSRNQLITLPPSLMALSQLKTLDVSSNNLRVLPRGFDRFKAKLQMLNLNGNRLRQ